MFYKYQVFLIFTINIFKVLICFYLFRTLKLYIILNFHCYFCTMGFVIFGYLRKIFLFFLPKCHIFSILGVKKAGSLLLSAFSSTIVQLTHYLILSYIIYFIAFYKLSNSLASYFYFQLCFANLRFLRLFQPNHNLIFNVHAIFSFYSYILLNWTLSILHVWCFLSSPSAS